MGNSVGTVAKEWSKLPHTSLNLAAVSYICFVKIIPEKMSVAEGTSKLDRPNVTHCPMICCRLGRIIASVICFLQIKSKHGSKTGCSRQI